MTKRLATTAIAAAALATLGSGCVSENTASVEPFAICAMPDDCMFEATCTQYLGALKFDPSFGEEMLLAFEMHNQLLNNAGEDGSGQVNTHDAHLESYTVEYRNSAGLVAGSTEGIPTTTSTIQQVIPAEGTSVVAIYPFPQSTVANLDVSQVPLGPDYRNVNLKVTFKGRFDDGSTWEAPYEFPVRLCQDCIGVLCENPDQIPVTACPSLFQEPHGAPVCVDAPTP